MCSVFTTMSEPMASEH